MIFSSKFLASSLNEGAGEQFHDIENPQCVCGHPFYDHAGHGCDHCEDCNDFIPVGMAKQVEHVAEYRSFGRIGKGTNPMVFARDPQRKERVLKVYLDDDKVTKVEFFENKGAKPETREGWDGFFSFCQAHGD